MASFLDGSGQVIKWLPYQPDKWATLLDHNHHELYVLACHYYILNMLT